MRQHFTAIRVDCPSAIAQKSSNSISYKQSPPATKSHRALTFFGAAGHVFPFLSKARRASLFPSSMPRVRSQVRLLLRSNCPK